MSSYQATKKPEYDAYLARLEEWRSKRKKGDNVTTQPKPTTISNKKMPSSKCTNKSSVPLNRTTRGVKRNSPSKRNQSPAKKPKLNENPKDENKFDFSTSVFILDTPIKFGGNPRRLTREIKDPKVLTPLRVQENKAILSKTKSFKQEVKAIINAHKYVNNIKTSSSSLGSIINKAPPKISYRSSSKATSDSLQKFPPSRLRNATQNHVKSHSSTAGSVALKHQDPRRQTQPIVGTTVDRSVCKRLDPRRQTQPIKTSSCNANQGKKVDSAAVGKDESPDMRTKLEKWKQKRAEKSNSKKTSTSASVRHSRCNQSAQSTINCRKPVHTKSPTRRSAPSAQTSTKPSDNKTFNNRRATFSVGSRNAHGTAKPAVKRPASACSVKPDSVPSKSSFTSSKSSLTPCRSGSWSVSTNPASARRSPRTQSVEARRISENLKKLNSVTRYPTSAPRVPGSATKPKYSFSMSTISSASRVRHRSEPVLQARNSTKTKLNSKGRKSILKPIPSVNEPEKPADSLTQTVVCCGNKGMATNRVTFQSPACGKEKFEMMKTPRKSLDSMTMRERLDYWLSAKSKTPSRYHHLHCFGQELSAQKKKKTPKAGLSSNELAHQQECLAEESSESLPDTSATLQEPVVEIPDQMQLKLREMISECGLLFEAGCPASSITSFLDDIAANIPQATEDAQYWVCRSHVAEQEGSDELAIELFEKAVQHQAVPAVEVADALKDFVVRMEDRKKATCLASHTPGPSKARLQLQEGANMFESSAVKYVVSNNTPLMKRLKPVDCPSTPRVVITPVRRSTRRSCSTLPSMLRDHDGIVESLLDVNDATALFQPNRALEQDFDAEED